MQSGSFSPSESLRQPTLISVPVAAVPCVFLLEIPTWSQYGTMALVLRQPIGDFGGEPVALRGDHWLNM